MKLALRKTASPVPALFAQLLEPGDAVLPGQRDAQFLKAGTRNYRADILVLIAASSVAGLVFLVWDTPEINEYVKGIVTLVLGRTAILIHLI